MFTLLKLAVVFICLLFFVIPSTSFIPSTRASVFQQRKAKIAIMSANDSDFQATVGLSSSAAQKAMLAAEKEAIANGWKVTIAIADAGGIPLLVKRCDGAFPASYEVATGKAKTAAQFCKNTGQLESAVNVDDGSSRTALLSAPFILMRGGVPIFVNGICVGAVGVSGVKPDEDEQVANAAVNALDSTHSKL